MLSYAKLCGAMRSYAELCEAVSCVGLHLACAEIIVSKSLEPSEEDWAIFVDVGGTRHRR